MYIHANSYIAFSGILTEGESWVTLKNIYRGTGRCTKNGQVKIRVKPHAPVLVSMPMIDNTA